MRLGRPLAAASAVAAMTGASLIASPALANSSNRNSPSSSSSPAPSSTAEATPAPSSTAEATPAPGKTSEGSSFKITQEKTFVSASTNTSFTVSGTGCTGKQATVGIALYAPDGTVSEVVKTNAASDGSWTSDLDLAALIKSIGSSAATTTDGWTIGAGCMTYGGKTETAQVTTQQQTKIYFDDTRISGSYEVSARTESESQTFTFNAQGFYASEKVTVLLKSKSDSSISYTLGELTVDANGNLTGNLPAPTDAPDGEYLLVLTGSHHSETATSQTVTTVSNHTFTVESTENNGGGDKQANGGGGDKTAIEQQKATEQQNTEQKASEQKATEQKATEQQKTEQKTSENNGGGNNGGSNSNANASENKGGTDQKVNDLNSNAKESSSDNRAGGETTKDSDRSLAHTGANGLIFGGIAVFLAVAGGAALLLRRRNKA
nr:LPXTG cell wall anchor domain-containing protein [uncultured Actinomyces sp.]